MHNVNMYAAYDEHGPLAHACTTPDLRHTLVTPRGRSVKIPLVVIYASLTSQTTLHQGRGPTSD